MIHCVYMQFEIISTIDSITCIVAYSLQFILFCTKWSDFLVFLMVACCNPFINISFSFNCSVKLYAKQKQLGAVEKGAAKRSRINAVYDW